MLTVNNDTLFKFLILHGIVNRSICASISAHLYILS